VVTGIGVFVSVATPFLIYAFTRPGGTSGYWIALGIGFGVIAGIVVGLLVESAQRGE
jgi:hypothetical protein